jgi:hypothetical protein
MTGGSACLRIPRSRSSTPPHRCSPLNSGKQEVSTHMVGAQQVGETMQGYQG